MSPRKRLLALWMVLLVACAACATTKNLEESPAKYTSTQLQRMGEKYLSAGDTGLALKYLTWADQKRPNDHEIQYDLGLAYAARGLRDQALVHFQTVLTIKPDYSEAHNAMGAVYADLGQLDKAEQAFKSCLANPFYQTPQYPLFNLGKIYEKRGNKELALKYYEDAARLQPSYANAHFRMGLILEDMNRTEEALRAYGKAIEYYPDMAEAHFRYGQINYTAGNLEHALYSFDRVVKLAPNSIMALEARKYLDEMQPLTSVEKSGILLVPSPEQFWEMEVMAADDVKRKKLRSTKTPAPAPSEVPVERLEPEPPDMPAAASAMEISPAPLAKTAVGPVPDKLIDMGIIGGDAPKAEVPVTSSVSAAKSAEEPIKTGDVSAGTARSPAVMEAKPGGVPQPVVTASALQKPLESGARAGGEVKLSPALTVAAAGSAASAGSKEVGRQPKSLSVSSPVVVEKQESAATPTLPAPRVTAVPHSEKLTDVTQKSAGMVKPSLSHTAEAPGAAGSRGAAQGMAPSGADSAAATARESEKAVPTPATQKAPAAETTAAVVSRDAGESHAVAARPAEKADLASSKESVKTPVTETAAPAAAKPTGATMASASKPVGETSAESLKGPGRTLAAETAMPAAAKNANEIASSVPRAAAKTDLAAAGGPEKITQTPPKAPAPLTEEPAEPPAVSSPADSGMLYIVQIGSYQQKSNADNIQRRLQIKGYEVVVKAFLHRSLGQLHVVQLKPVGDSARAKTLRMQLEREERLQPVILKFPAGD